MALSLMHDGGVGFNRSLHFGTYRDLALKSDESCAINQLF